jgi:hypothetical protein
MEKNFRVLGFRERVRGRIGERVLGFSGGFLHKICSILHHGFF